jgi:hypothetical protein
VCQSALCQQVVRCEATSICTAQGAAKPACNSCAREAQLEWQLLARAEEQKEQERRDSYNISQRTKIDPIVVIVHDQRAGVVHDVPNFNGVNYFKNMIGRNNVADVLIVPELRMVRRACSGALRVRARSIIHSFYRRTMMLIMVTSTTPACAPVA